MGHLCSAAKDEPTDMFDDGDDLELLRDPPATTTDDQASDSNLSSNSTDTQAANHGNNLPVLSGNQNQTNPSNTIANSVRALPDEDFIGCMKNLLDDAFYNNAARATLDGPLQEKLNKDTRTIQPKKLENKHEWQLAQLWRKEGTLSVNRPHNTNIGPVGLSWEKVNGASGTRMDPTKNKLQQKETMKTSAGL